MRFDIQRVMEYQKTGEKEMGHHSQRIDAVGRTGEGGCMLPGVESTVNGGRSGAGRCGVGPPAVRWCGRTGQSPESSGRVLITDCTNRMMLCLPPSQLCVLRCSLWKTLRILFPLSLLLSSYQDPPPTSALRQAPGARVLPVLGPSHAALPTPTDPHGQFPSTEPTRLRKGALSPPMEGPPVPSSHPMATERPT